MEILADILYTFKSNNREDIVLEWVLDNFSIDEILNGIDDNQKLIDYLSEAGYTIGDE